MPVNPEPDDLREHIEWVGAVRKRLTRPPIVATQVPPQYVRDIALPPLTRATALKR